MSICLPYDPVAAVRHLGEADPVMADLTAKVGECGLDPRVDLDPFQELLRSIVYQQLSGHAAASILNRVLGLFDSNFPTPTALLKTADDQLRSCGLSWSKIRAVKDLADKTREKLLPAPKDIAGMSSEEIIKAFSTVRGIGPWTVEMLLISMGRPDILPVTDLGVRRGFSVAYETGELPTPKELLERGECWRPFRSVASWYLWQAASPKFRAESA
ncbi:MAG: DNA-3-methyladenine glycosylase 2 family protein [Gammaproteobacteria bacterium]|nr:DNA-3-methyladenine glycosylase 2 family protein [Gammaproteobacteria bacterium]